ncbi:MAG: hypothetical protein AAGF49_00620 [Pseudomonadota bacterium]
MRAAIAALAAAAFVAASALPAGAQLEPIAPECAPLVGTFLTLRVTETGAPADPLGRSLIALTNGGHASMSDSAQGGIAGYQPFSDARGSWICHGAQDDGTITFKAVMIDFTYPTQDKPDALVVRVETVGTLDAGGLVLSGETNVSFYPLASDPLGGDAPSSSTRYTFTGHKVLAQ